MTLTNARATLGLSATATLSASGTSGSIQLGPTNKPIRLDAVTSGYSLLAVFAASGDSVTLDLDNAVAPDVWVAGNAQVETATAVGTITTAGNATAIVTSAGMTGSPLTVTFAVALSDTASLWAAKARTALAANATIAERFTVSGTTTAVVLTRKPTHTFTVPGGTLPIYAATDGTLNIALADDTSAGITEAATSANTTVGVASDGVRIYDADTKDLDGNTITLTTIHGFQSSLISTAACTMVGSVDDITTISAGETFTRASATGIAMDLAQTFTAGAPASLAITVLGS